MTKTISLVTCTIFLSSIFSPYIALANSCTLMPGTNGRSGDAWEGHVMLILINYSHTESFVGN